ncbi:MAG TPA: chitobiase/beta-hexosaminidase C-terminal domain-containing protein, partial [Candidatus Dojkabacteria bacterium]|nr:chitobiase/beta-hexosaminidase C-terminal domain-containing protein [Candidatus Dojkabacteria bacterium]
RNQLGKIAISNFIVDYDVSVPQAAETAFDYAVEIWSHLIALSKPVKIKVSYIYEPGGILGQTSVNQFRNNYSGLPKTDRQYPISLAKNLDNNINFNDYDITMVFNGNQPFNYATDGQPVTNQYDFVSVALHEIGHGLGLYGAANIDENGNASISFSGHPNYTSNSYPTISDEYYVSGSTKLIDVTNPNTLKNLLLSNNVYFNGSNAKIANNNQNVKMYAPSIWEGGSSIDHLDEDTFPAGNENSLMTPYIDRAEVNHSPGKIFLAMLKDYGHTLGRNITFNSPIAGSQIVKNQNFTVKWFDNISGLGDYIDLELWKVTSVDPMFISTINTSPIYSSPGTTNNTFNWLVSNTLSDGFYFLKAVGYNHTVSLGKSTDFSISTIPEAPHFSPPPSQYATTQYVSLYTNSPVSEIRYTLDGSEPTPTSPIFTPASAIVVSSSIRIRARSYLILSDNSKVASPTSDADYYIGANSFVKEFTTSSGNYGWIYYGTVGAGSGINWIQMGLPSDNNDAKYRSYAKWSGIKSQIPAGAYIQSVEFDIPVNQIMTTAASLEFRYYSGGGDIINKWNNIGAGTPVATMPANSGIFSIQGFVSYIQAIVNGGGDYFAIGIKSSNESNIDHYTSYGFPIRMRIYYRGNIEISQLDKDNQQFGQVEYWNATYWDPKNAPATLFKTGNVTLKSYQDFKEGTTQKYKEWLRQTDIVNFNTFPITANVVNFFDAKFDQSNLSPKVKNYYSENSSLDPTTDKIWFKDPWLQDEIVATYGKRNQGISGGTTGEPGADWHQLNSPIDFSQSDFSAYQGVFLNQDYNIPGKPYYSVKADAVQDLPLFTTGVPTGNGRTHKFYFQNWSGSNVIFQNSNALETPV